MYNTTSATRRCEGVASPTGPSQELSEVLYLASKRAVMGGRTWPRFDFLRRDVSAYSIVGSLKTGKYLGQPEWKETAEAVVGFLHPLLGLVRSFSSSG